MSKLKPAFFVLLIYAICFLISVINSYASEESLTITTYYPSPYGSYRELRSQRIAIGDNYIAGDQYCWEGTCTNTINANADLVVEGNVGIGTVDPMSGVGNGSLKRSLEVNGWVLARGNGSNTWGDPQARIGVVNNGDSNINAWWMSANTDNYFAIHQSGIGDRLTIDRSGNVGIGTTGPGAKLDVNGGIRFSPSDSVWFSPSYGVGYYDLGAKSFCAMAGYSDSDDANPGNSSCDVSFSNGKWYLSVALSGDMSVTCKAVCIN